MFELIGLVTVTILALIAGGWAAGVIKFGVEVVDETSRPAK